MKREQFVDLLARFTGTSIIAVPRILVDVTGDWTVAAMLNQLLYWNGKNGTQWVYKSLKDWQVEVGCVTEYAVKKLKSLPFVISKVKRANSVPTTHYQIDFDILLDEILNAISRENRLETVKTRDQRNLENTNSLTKNTQENTDSLKGMHHEIVIALESVSGLDMKIRSNVGKIVKSAKELRQAGYTASHVLEFGKQWKNDWRYKADKSLPSLKIILSEISKVKLSETYNSDDKLKLALQEIEKAKGK